MCVKLLESFAKDKLRFVNYILKLETGLKSIETSNEQHALGISWHGINCLLKLRLNMLICKYFKFL
jgi:hypothetical protein